MIRNFKKTSKQISILQKFYKYYFSLRQIEYEQRKKAEGKKARDEKDKVLEMLFAAFEKHQYYNVKDLVKITNQPIVSSEIFNSG